MTKALYGQLNGIANNYCISSIAQEKSNIRLGKTFSALQAMYEQIQIWNKEKKSLEIVRGVLSMSINNKDLTVSEANLIANTMGITRESKQIPTKACERIENYFNAVIVASGYIRNGVFYKLAVLFKTKELLENNKIDKFVYDSVIYTFGLQTIKDGVYSILDIMKLSELPEYSDTARGLIDDVMELRRTDKSKGINKQLDSIDVSKEAANTSEIEARKTLIKQIQSLVDLSVLGAKHRNWVIGTLEDSRKAWTTVSDASNLGEIEEDLLSNTCRVKLSELKYYYSKPVLKLIAKMVSDMSAPYYSSIGEVVNKGFCPINNGDTGYSIGTISINTNSTTAILDWNIANYIVRKSINWTDLYNCIGIVDKKWQEDNIIKVIN